MALFSDPVVEELVEAVYAGGVAASNRRHSDDLAVDELDAVALGKDARLAHRVVVVYGKQVRLECDVHNGLG